MLREAGIHPNRTFGIGFVATRDGCTFVQTERLASDLSYADGAQEVNVDLL